MNQSDEHREAVQVSVDVVLLTLVEQQLHAVLLRRQAAPFAGVWALPGGFIHTEEDADAKASAARVLRTKVGIEGAYLEQLATFSGPARDPRGWSVAIAYCALLPVQNLPPNRSDISVVPLSALPQLPFDHRAILDVAVLADQDQLVVAPQHSVEPDVGALFQFNLAHQHGIGRDPALWVGLDTGVAQAVFHCVVLKAQAATCSGHSSDGIRY